MSIFGRSAPLSEPKFPKWSMLDVKKSTCGPKIRSKCTLDPWLCPYQHIRSHNEQTSKKLPFCGFWCSIKEKHPQLSNMAISNNIFPFPTVYLCDARFSTETRNHRTWQKEQKRAFGNLLWSKTLKFLQKHKTMLLLFSCKSFCFEKNSYFSLKSFTFVNMGWGLFLLF